MKNEPECLTADDLLAFAVLCLFIVWVYALPDIVAWIYGLAAVM